MPLVEPIHSICTRLQHQSGLVLLWALSVSVALLTLFLGIARLTLTEFRFPANLHAHEQALHAAELALADAEADIRDAPAASPRGVALSRVPEQSGAPSCGSGDHNPAQGICKSGINLTMDWSQSVSVACGHFTGRCWTANAVLQVQKPPRYVIEILPPPAPDMRLFRISAIGFGPGSETRALVQSVYRLASVPSRTSRLSWREMIDQEELQ